MASELFQVVAVNPNDNCGGGGCVCDERKQSDCKPPYVVFYATDMASVVSPQVVVCANCINQAAKKLKGEVLAGGEVNPNLAPEQEGAKPPL